MRVGDFTVRIILNSKAEPNLEVCVNGFCSSPPSGTSRSKKEVNPWPNGKTLLDSVRKARKHAEEILSELKGRDVDPVEVEKALVARKEEIGGNTLLAVSISLYKAAAVEEGLPPYQYIARRFSFEPKVPKPLENVIGGGKHGGGTDIQEFLLFPRFDGTPEEYILTLSEVYRRIKEELKRRDSGFLGCLTLESAWVTTLPTEEILGLLRKFADEYDLGLGVDVAASDIFDGNAYNWQKEGVIRDRDAHIDYIVDLANTYGLDYIEDPVEENDKEGFLEVQKRVKGKVVGDDVFATNRELLFKGVGGIIIKYNQRGSIVETVETVKEARKMGMMIVPSHRSGESEDRFLTHFAVGIGGDLIKAGAAEIRTVKLNELVRIQRSLLRE